MPSDDHAGDEPGVERVVESLTLQLVDTDLGWFYRVTGWDAGSALTVDTSGEPARLLGDARAALLRWLRPVVNGNGAIVFEQDGRMREGRLPVIGP